MNLINFLKQTDAITLQYSKEQLIDFVHDIGRVCPEHRREDFLEMLKSAGNGAVRASNKNEDKDIDFNEMYSRVSNHLKGIDSHEVTITAVLNEEYDDWYDDRGEEFYYEDNDGISDMLEEACDFVHICMDREKYKEGFAVGKQLLEMELLCDNEYGDEELSLGDMARYELLNCDLKRVILDTAYCAYQSAPPVKRPEALYGVILNAKEDTVTLEAVMQHGEEDLPEFEEFLPSWITYLGDKTGHDADRLILEAVDLLNDLSLEVQCAEKYAAVHPELYLNILENEKHMPADDMVAIGLEAMKAIPKKYVIRSKAALKTAEYVIAADGGLSLLEKCYFAACESDTSAQNYLRALLNGYGNGKKREELQKLLRRFPGHKSNGFLLNERSFREYGGNVYFEREENKPNNNMILALRFLDGQFAEVLDKGLHKAEEIGCTGTCIV